MQLTDLYQQALVFAFVHHQHHERKGSGIPYMAHLLSVSSLVLEHGGTEKEAIAALLHDVLEDVGDHLKPEIQDKFGEEVLQVVLACTDGTHLEKRNARHPLEHWLARKTFYVQNLHHKSFSARLVGLADKVHNARAILEDYTHLNDETWKRFKTGKWGTLWYYRALRDGYAPTPQDPEGYCHLYQLFEDVTYTLEHLTGVEHLSTEDLRGRVLV